MSRPHESEGHHTRHSRRRRSLTSSRLRSNVSLHSHSQRHSSPGTSNEGCRSKERYLSRSIDSHVSRALCDRSYPHQSHPRDFDNYHRVEVSPSHGRNQREHSRNAPNEDYHSIDDRHFISRDERFSSRTSCEGSYDHPRERHHDELHESDFHNYQQQAKRPSSSHNRYKHSRGDHHSRASTERFHSHIPSEHYDIPRDPHADELYRSEIDDSPRTSELRSEYHVPRTGSRASSSEDFSSNEGQRIRSSNDSTDSHSSSDRYHARYHESYDSYYHELDEYLHPSKSRSYYRSAGTDSRPPSNESRYSRASNESVDSRASSQSVNSRVSRDRYRASSREGYQHESSSLDCDIKSRFTNQSIRSAPSASSRPPARSRLSSDYDSRYELSDRESESDYSSCDEYTLRGGEGRTSMYSPRDSDDIVVSTNASTRSEPLSVEHKRNHQRDSRVSRSGHMERRMSHIGRRDSRVSRSGHRDPRLSRRVRRDSRVSRIDELESTHGASPSAHSPSSSSHAYTPTEACSTSSRGTATWRDTMAVELWQICVARRSGAQTRASTEHLEADFCSALESLFFAILKRAARDGRLSVVLPCAQCMVASLSKLSLPVMSSVGRNLIDSGLDVYSAVCTRGHEHPSRVSWRDAGGCSNAHIDVPGLQYLDCTQELEGRVSETWDGCEGANLAQELWHTQSKFRKHSVSRTQSAKPDIAPLRDFVACLSRLSAHRGGSSLELPCFACEFKPWLAPTEIQELENALTMQLGFEISLATCDHGHCFPQFLHWTQ